MTEYLTKYSIQQTLKKIIAMKNDIVEIDLSDFCKIRLIPGVDDFLFVFSGANVKRGSFNYYKSLIDSNLNLVFLNDSLNRYYQDGIIGVSDDTTECIKKFKEIMYKHSNGKERSFTFGCSMGGYAALIYGSMLNSEKILAFSPSIPKYCSVLWQNKDYDKVSSKSVNFIELIKESKTKKLIFYGDRGIGDICSFKHCSELKNTNITIYKNTCHALIYTISQKISTLDLILSFISNDNEMLFSITELEEYRDFSFLERAYLWGDFYFQKKDISNLPLLNNNELNVGAFLSAYIEIIYKHNIDDSLKMFFELMKKCLNIRVMKLLIPILSPKNIEKVYLLMCDELFSNPSLFGYDGTEKRNLADMFFKIFQECKKINSNRNLVSSDFEGYFDHYDGDFFYGWAFKKNSNTQKISISLNGKSILNGVCDLFRGDLKTSQKGIGGKCAFKENYTLEKLINNKSFSKYNKIRVITQQGNELTNSNSYICQPFFIGSIDTISDNVLKGWVVNHVYKNAEIRLSVYLNGFFYRTLKLEVKRNDLYSIGYSMMSGFEIAIDSNDLIKGMNLVDIYCYDKIAIFKKIQLWK